MWVLFDVNATLLSLEPVRETLTGQGYPGDVLEAWFTRMLQGSDSLTLAARYRPFAELAEPSLRHVLAVRSLPDDGVAAAVRALRSDLVAREDAQPCLAALGAAGHDLAAFSRSGEESTRAHLERTGLAARIRSVLSCDAVGATKPAGAAYRYALGALGARAEDTVFVAAHGWDVVGADAAGMRTVWVSDVERVWPLPGEPPGAVVASLTQVPDIVAAE